jgi:regulator of ribonuclease activity A
MKPTADLCDLYEDQVAVLPSVFRSYGGKNKFYGSIVTIKTLDDNSLVRQTLEQEGLGRILFVDGQASMNCALLGDRLAELAIRNGWAGVVVNGCIRDSHEIGTMPIGVMARGTNPRKSQKRGAGDLNETLVIEGVTVSPGQYLYADDDGILISQELLI